MPNSQEMRYRILAERLSAILGTNCNVSGIPSFNVFSVHFSPEKTLSDLQGYALLLNDYGIDTNVHDDVVALMDPHEVPSARKLTINGSFNEIMDALQNLNLVVRIPRVSILRIFFHTVPNLRVITEILPPNLESFINSFKGKELFPEIFEKLGIEISPNYRCNISLDIPEIPVLIDGHLYDFNYLIKLPLENGLRTNPITREKFTLKEVMPGRVFVSIFETLIQQTEQKDTVSMKCNV